MGYGWAFRALKPQTEGWIVYILLCSFLLMLYELMKRWWTMSENELLGRIVINPKVMVGKP
jgi:hypothetical protein